MTATWLQHAQHPRGPARLPAPDLLHACLLDGWGRRMGDGSKNGGQRKNGGWMEDGRMVDGGQMDGGQTKGEQMGEWIRG